MGQKELADILNTPSASYLHIPQLITHSSDGHTQPYPITCRKHTLTMHGTALYYIRSCMRDLIRAHADRVG